MTDHRYFLGLQLILILGLGMIAPLKTTAQDSKSDLISQPGQYEGYSVPIYDGWQRSSCYVTVSDGTRLALDIFRPTRHNRLHQDALPVIWEQRRYQRASQDKNGNISSQLDRSDHPMCQVIRYGYIYAVADVRGSGASFGTRIDPTPPQESQDAYDLTEWLATQPWCNGKVGMYGISYGGTAQFMAASTAPPHLKAIFPEMAMFDLYDLGYPGGIYRHSLMRNWAKQTQDLDLHRQKIPAPVNLDQSKDLKQARQEHRGNYDVSRAQEAPFRDSSLDGAGSIYLTHSPNHVIDKVNASGVAVYQRAGWFDMYPRDMLLWHHNLTGPKKIVIGPWNHYQSQGLDRATEMLRWYDYWLKDIDNGIMDEPPILYGVMGLPKDKALRRTQQWPPTDIPTIPYYFGPGPSASIDSINDGLLELSPPMPHQDHYTIDYTATSGSRTRWTGTGPPRYDDMTTNDCKALTYTTAPMTQNMEIVGHPILHVWLDCTVDDVDLFAYLEEVTEDGQSQYLTEGCLRASHRLISKAPYANFGLPYHRSFQEDQLPLTQGRVELVFDLYPTANFVEAGHRIRLAITGADQDSSQAAPTEPAPQITVYSGTNYESHLILPIKASSP